MVGLLVLLSGVRGLFPMEGVTFNLRSTHVKVAFLRQLAVDFFLSFFFPISHAGTLVVFFILHSAEIVWKTIGLFLIWCFRKLGKIEIRLYSKVEKEHVNSNNWNL